MADVIITNHGTIIVFTLNSKVAKNWWNEKISDDEDNAFNKKNCVAEHRYAENIINGMKSSGLRIK